MTVADGGIVWIIADGRDCSPDSVALAEKIDGDTVTEYRISDFARYLLSPRPIEVQKRLIGCEVHYRPGISKSIRAGIRRMLPGRLKGLIDANCLRPEILVANLKLKIPSLKDPDLERHLQNIVDGLRRYDSITRRLPRLNARQIKHIIGICEDVGGNLSYLKLQGEIEDKIKYLANNFSRDVGISLRRAYIGDGLFELRGFDFGRYQPGRAHRLVSYLKNGQRKIYVLDAKNKIECPVDNDRLLKYLLLLEQSIRMDPKLKTAFDLCAGGLARPIKLFFNNDLEIDYSKAPLPRVYKEVFQSHKLGGNQKNLVKPSLNYLQIGISLNYVPLSDCGEERLVTDIAVLHDLRALEGLKTNLPRVYSEISKRTFQTEAGRFYLLDSMEGHSNV